MIIDPTTIPPLSVYKLLSGTVVPRPIAWISTVSRDGLYNLAPFSFFTVASRNPPMSCISIGPGVGEREGTEKDTLKNIKDTKEFVINVVSPSLVKPMHETSGNFATDVDEFQVSGLTTGECELVKAPRVLEAPINMECQLEKILELGSDHLVIGKMVRYHIQDDLLIYPDKVDLEQLRPVGRLANKYTVIDKLFVVIEVQEILWQE